MNKLQPSKKSFNNYIKLGYEYKNRGMSDKQITILRDISAIDDAVLIMDDIFDESKFRNGKPCLYLQKGVQEAILTSELLRVKAIEALVKLMDASKTSNKKRKEIFEKINEFFKCVYLGEKIDLELDSIKEYSPYLTKKYLKMVRLFTGGHIKFGLEIGQLLQNKKVDLKLSELAVHLGVIRQICDDFNDYFKEHHEPFGDFTAESNRLPELIFKKFKGNRTVALSLIRKKKYAEARKFILSPEVKNELYNYCKKEYLACEKISTTFNYKTLTEDFGQILKK